MKKTKAEIKKKMRLVYSRLEGAKGPYFRQNRKMQIKQFSFKSVKFNDPTHKLLKKSCPND